MKALTVALAICASTTTLALQQQSKHRRIETITAEEKELLSHMRVVYLDDGQGGTAKTIRFTGVNVQVVNGTGATNSPGGTNGVGNLIVGYNELGNDFGDDRTGSHNIVGGRTNNYTDYGGFVVSEDNEVFRLGSIAGGRYNRTGGVYSSIAGGRDNETAGGYSAISGGSDNSTLAGSSTVGGGRSRRAEGDNDWVAGALVEDN